MLRLDITAIARKAAPVSAVLLSLGLPQASRADTLTAKALLDMPDDKQRYMYIAGVVAGLSTARFVRDGNDGGSACIEKWFYDTAGIKETIYRAFERFGDKAPSAIIHALATRECGK